MEVKHDNKKRRSIVEIVIFRRGSRIPTAARSATTGRVAELELSSKTALLLQLLGKHFVLADVGVAH